MSAFITLASMSESGNRFSKVRLIQTTMRHKRYNSQACSQIAVELFQRVDSLVQYNGRPRCLFRAFQIARQQPQLFEIRMNVQPVSLTGRRVRLEPLSQSHVEQLWVAGQEKAIWRFLPLAPESIEDIRQFVSGAEKLCEAGQGLGFAIIDLSTNKAVGSTGYWNLAPEHARLEIGMTWLRPESQRTGINTEMKYLLVTHAFEELGCERVEFKTDARNTQSQIAMQRIGLVKEGVLRNHMRYPTGERRDTMYFSVIKSEWPKMKAHLESLLNAHDKSA